MLDITPDWTMIRTARGAEEEFAGFKWRGPGWYTDLSGQTLLAIPMSDDVRWFPDMSPDMNPWKQSWPEDQNFLFLSYSAPPYESFNAVANAPTRQDDYQGGPTRKFEVDPFHLLERSATVLGKNVLGLPCFCDTPELHSDKCVAVRELVLKLRASNG